MTVSNGWNDDRPREAATTPRQGGLSGRWLVVGMFAFAITTTSILYLYWKMHVGPFLPLQKALAAQFDDSRPLVEGGQRKMHKNTPRILRITMKVDFDPTADEAQAGAFADRVVEFTRAHYSELSAYEVLEIHLFYPQPEKTIREWTRKTALIETE
jgi:hypothetical protein